MRTMRHIMVATVGSEAADRTLDVAAAIIKAVGGELSILTVGEQPSGDELRRLAL
jgi:nucleotide-binding universal stress UspA family protein